MRVVTASAHQRLFGREPVGTAFIEEVDDAFCLGHDLGADPVAGKKKQIMSGHLRLAVTGTRGLLKGLTAIGKRSRAKFCSLQA
jgi:hypothetical protein